MGINPSEEESSNIEIVQPGQEFILFDPSRTVVKRHTGGGEIPEGQTVSIESEILLSISSLPNIPFVAEANLGTTLYRYFGATPFDPDIGTRITTEDYNVESRVRKWIELRRKRIEELGEAKAASLHTYVEPKAPLSLLIGAYPNIWDDPRFTIPSHGDDDNYVAAKIRPEFQEVFQNIGLTLTFPESSWSGVPLGLGENDSGRLFFVYFHPLNTPPLAIAPERKWDEGGAFHKGVSLFVPDDLERLTLIKGRF